jgi:glycine/D-amino acid oxidase-like deaminating enzyme
MTSLLDKEQFATQLASKPGQVAPCPSTFSEGRSYWISEFPIDFEDECRAEPVPTQVDVVVIGTGITGAAVLHVLAENKPDLKVAAFDARGICSGATGRNGGHICAPEGTQLRLRVQKHGKEEAVRLAKLHTRNRDLMLAAMEKAGIANDVDLRLEGTRVVFASQQERDTYLAERQCAKELGIELESYLMEAEDLCHVRSLSAMKA